MTQPKDIEGLRKVAEEATPGPWKAVDAGQMQRVDAPHPDVGSVGVCRMDWTRGPHEAAANARFIATFNPERVSALLSELEAVKGERDEALKLMSEYARKAGEATGRLEMSEAAGIVDGWRERAEAAEAALVSLKGGGGSSVAESGSTASPKSDGLCKSEGGEP